MEARFSRSARRCNLARRVGSAALLALSVPQLISVATAAGYRTKNFTVAAPSPQLAKEIGDSAERWRRVLAIEWLGKELPAWSKPCPIKARVSPNLGAGGATSFVFDHGKVFGWRMDIQGSRERILDSVVPHEVTHTIFASHFCQPLPRWADEGACTTVEHHSEIAKQEHLLIEFLKTRRGIPFSAMFAMKEYPRDVLPLYAQGHSLAKYLIAQKGKREFLAFVGDGMQDENWPRAIRQHYGYDHLLALQESWMDWIRRGRPEIRRPESLVASNSQPQNDRRQQVAAAPAMAVVVRGQDPKATRTPTRAKESIYAASLASSPITPTTPAPAPTSSPPSPQDWPGEQAIQGVHPPARPSVYDASRGEVMRR